MTGPFRGDDPPIPPAPPAGGRAEPRRTGPMVVGIIGAGNVTGQYLPSLLSYPDIQVRGIADLDAGRAASVAAEYRLPFSGTAAELLAIDDIELVVNLTTPAAHAGVALAVIESGRHLWGEKPLTMDRESAGAVLAAAATAGVAVGNAPDTILGPAIQNSQRLLAQGAIGAPQTVLTLMQGPGPDRWHPRPQFLFAPGAGPLFDIGPYYLTTMVQLLGPIAKVEAAGHRARAQRVIGAGPDAGATFPVEVDTHVSVLTTFRSGVVGTSVYSFDSTVQPAGVRDLRGTRHPGGAGQRLRRAHPPAARARARRQLGDDRPAGREPGPGRRRAGDGPRHPGRPPAAGQRPARLPRARRPARHRGVGRVRPAGAGDQHRRPGPAARRGLVAQHRDPPARADPARADPAERIQPERTAQ